MAQFNDHIAQAQSNLRFLQYLNSGTYVCYDWQVTVCFYAALHIINGHLIKYNLQYRRHSDVNYAINPASVMSPGRIPDEQYKAYIKLQNLSRRARYIVHEDIKLDDGSRAFLTHDAHLKKAFKNLDILLSFFNTLYSLAIPEMNIVCQGLKQTELAFFKI